MSQCILLCTGKQSCLRAMTRGGPERVSTQGSLAAAGRHVAQLRSLSQEEPRETEYSTFRTDYGMAETNVNHSTF
jgi:hypothetical protein